MGFGLLLVWPIITTALSAVALRLLLLGGAAYVVGIFFFVMGEYKPIYHTIWHLFVVLGASLHWFDIYFYIASTQLHADAIDPRSASTSLLSAYPQCSQFGGQSGPGSGFGYNASST